MNFKAIFPLNIFVYFFNQQDDVVKQAANTELVISRRLLVWKKNPQTQRLECGFITTKQLEEEPAPNNYLLAC